VGRGDVRTPGYADRQALVLVEQIAMIHRLTPHRQVMSVIGAIFNVVALWQSALCALLCGWFLAHMTVMFARYLA